MALCVREETIAHQPREAGLPDVPELLTEEVRRLLRMYAAKREVAAVHGRRAHARQVGHKRPQVPADQRLIHGHDRVVFAEERPQPCAAAARRSEDPDELAFDSAAPAQCEGLGATPGVHARTRPRRFLTTLRAVTPSRLKRGHGVARRWSA